MALTLRPLVLADEVEATRADEELLAGDFTFLLFRDRSGSWAEYLADLEAVRTGARLAEGMVPASFFVADVDGAIVGRTSIRHELNASLARVGGHIGYAVRPAWRRRGYATEILRASLEIVHALGVDRVLVTCDETNVGSATVIERCGGVLDGELGEATERRYWIT